MLICLEAIFVPRILRDPDNQWRGERAIAFHDSKLIVRYCKLRTAGDGLQQQHSWTAVAISELIVRLGNAQPEVA